MTRHQVDPRLLDDSELTRHLLAARGTQWMRGNRGDPYALILRAQGIDPHALYRGMRGRPALRQSESDTWVTASYTAGAEVLEDERLTLRDPKARRRRKVFGIDAGSSLKHVLQLDDDVLARPPAFYTELSAAVAPVLGSAALERHRGAVDGVFERTLGSLGGSFDLMEDFARPGTVAAVAELLGLSEAERAEVAGLCPGAGTALDALLCPPTLGMTRRLVESFDGLRKVVDTLVAARSAAPGDDPVSRLLREAPDPGGAAADATVALMLTLVVGVETTANLVCDAVLALLADPGQLALVREDPGLVVGAVEETLRFQPPVRLESRIVSEEVQIAGQRLDKGHQVVVLVDAAGRDPEVYPEPERFLVDRAPGVPPLSLHGRSPAGFTAPVVRFVAGAALGRLVADRVGTLGLAGDVVRRMRSPVVQGVARCPVAATQAG
ncbi:cytochrome P450 family protein [Streptomyces ardesiacus]|uniref:cytochrome P450 family protein n=1 Tax=Streptomyces ardesiacus TaxID=285564 RepID=UPI00201F0E42|nr:P450-derived glycosyltransferase activator [Streptomyces ardesiacus]MCL7370150.1 P450-derived glycosyltransferase activator [Streptomyces ardesiacus]